MICEVRLAQLHVVLMVLQLVPVVVGGNNRVIVDAVVVVVDGVEDDGRAGDDASCAGV